MSSRRAEKEVKRFIGDRMNEATYLQECSLYRFSEDSAPQCYDCGEPIPLRRFSPLSFEHAWKPKKTGWPPWCRIAICPSATCNARTLVCTLCPFTHSRLNLKRHNMWFEGNYKKTNRAIVRHASNKLHEDSLTVRQRESSSVDDSHSALLSVAGLPDDVADDDVQNDLTTEDSTNEINEFGQKYKHFDSRGADDTRLLLENMEGRKELLLYYQSHDDVVLGGVLSHTATSCMHRVAMKAVHGPSIANEAFFKDERFMLTDDELKLFLRLGALLTKLTPQQRLLFAEVMSSHRSHILSANNMEVHKSPTLKRRRTTMDNRSYPTLGGSHGNMRRMFWEGEHALFNNLPLPIVSLCEDREHAYVSIKSAIQYALGTWVKVTFLDQQTGPGADFHAPICSPFKTERARAIMESVGEKFFEDGGKVLLVKIFSDGAEPNAVKQNRGGVWIMTIHLMYDPSSKQRMSDRNTLVLSLGKGNVTHTEYVRLFVEEMLELATTDTQFYYAWGRCWVPCRVIPFATIQDYPERCHLHGVSQRGKYTKRWGYLSLLSESATAVSTESDRTATVSTDSDRQSDSNAEPTHIDNSPNHESLDRDTLLNRLVSCDSCYEGLLDGSGALYKDTRSPPAGARCPECCNFNMLDPRMDFFPPRDGWPKGNHVDNFCTEEGKIAPREQLLPEILRNIRHARLHYRRNFKMNEKKSWTKKEATQFLKCTTGISQEFITEALGAKRTSIGSSRENFHLQLRNETVSCPPMWRLYRDGRLPPTPPMHLYFLGNTKAIVVDLLVPLFRLDKKWPQAWKMISSCLLLVRTLGLDYCRAEGSSDSGKFGGYVSENWVAVARLAPWMLGGLLEMLNVPSQSERIRLEVVRLCRAIVAVMGRAFCVPVTRETPAQLMRFCKILLNAMVRVDKWERTHSNNKDRDLAIVSRSNTSSILSGRAYMEEYGSFRWLWEGGVGGEGAFRLVKPVCHGYRTGWQCCALKNIYRFGFIKAHDPAVLAVVERIREEVHEEERQEEVHRQEAGTEDDTTAEEDDATTNDMTGIGATTSPTNAGKLIGYNHRLYDSIEALQKEQSQGKPIAGIVLGDHNYVVTVKSTRKLPPTVDPSKGRGRQFLGSELVQVYFGGPTSERKWRAGCLYETITFSSVGQNTLRMGVDVRVEDITVFFLMLPWYGDHGHGTIFEPFYYMITSDWKERTSQGTLGLYEVA